MLAVIGLGATGLSILRYCQRKNMACWVGDTRENPPAFLEFQQTFPEVPFYLGEIPEEQLLLSDAIILSPGLPRDLPLFRKAKEKNIPIIGDIELFVREAKAPIVAITGTNAKGTVTTMMGSILHAAEKIAWLGGNIGTPALDLLIKPVPDYYVLELSSYQLESTFSLAAEVAIILNVTDDHLDHHGSMANYIAAKQRIYHQAKHIVYNADDVATYPSNKSAAISFALLPPTKEHALGVIENHLAYQNKNFVYASDLKVKGKHNWMNALAAAGLALSLNISLEKIREGLMQYAGLPHRCEWLTCIDNVNWYNDSKGTNVGATIAAIQGLGSSLQQGKIILIAGGQGKGQDFTPLQMLCEEFVRVVILFGQDANILQKALEKFCEVVLVENLEEAVSAAERASSSGDVVLLSPACASLDMFKNFEDRGERFRNLVKGVAFRKEIG